MKTAISIPDRVFKSAERLAKKMGLSRSELYSRAVGKFLAEHDEKELIRRANEVADNVDTSLDPALRRSQTHVIHREDW